MNLRSETRGICLVVTVDADRIDAATAVQFKDDMRRAVTDTAERVLLDLSAVDSIDSSGLGAIVSVMKYLGADRRLELVSLSQKVQTVFRLTRMDAVITIHENLERAVEPAARAS
ncbi:MAG: STAS domain-containing protein [Pseudomonadota bacterium]